MSDLIRLEDVLAIIDKRTVKGKLQVAREVLKLPTIEPRCETCEAFNKTRLLIPQPERKKGKWIPVTRIYKVTEGQFPNTHIEWVDATEPDEIDAVRCSECREVFDFQDARNWCTECGADMRTPVETAKDIVHEAINNSVWSDTVDTAKMHKVVNDKYAEMTEDEA